jgi:hypothetical protein
MLSVTAGIGGCRNYFMNGSVMCLPDVEVSFVLAVVWSALGQGGMSQLLPLLGRLLAVCLWFSPLIVLHIGFSAELPIKL